MKASGVVMETNQSKGKVTVYTSQGQFLEVPAPGHAVYPGEMIEVFIKETKKHKPKILFGSFVPAAAAVLALFMFLGMYLTVFSVPASAYVALDFNPSLELEVSKDARVTNARSFNEGGQKLLDELDLKDVDVYEAVKLIMERAALEGFIKRDGDNVFVAGVVPVANYNAVKEQELKAVIVDTFKEKKVNGYVSVYMSSEKERKKALNEGLSVNRYMVMNRYHELGNNISPVEMNHSNMMELAESKEINSMFGGHHYEAGRNNEKSHMQNGSGMSGGENVSDRENGMSSHNNNMNDMNGMSGDNGAAHDTGTQLYETNNGSMMNNNLNKPDDNMHSVNTEDKKQERSGYMQHEERYEGNMPYADQMNQNMTGGHE